MPTPHSSTAPTEEFPQGFAQQLFQDIVTLNRVLYATHHSTMLAGLPECAVEEEGWPCARPAVVTHLETELECCAKHFLMVERG